MSYYENISRWKKEIPGCVKTQKMSDEAVEFEPRSLAFVPDSFKIEDICSNAVGRDAYTLVHVPDHLKTQEMRNKAISENPVVFCLGSDCFKT